MVLMPRSQPGDPNGGDVIESPHGRALRKETHHAEVLETIYVHTLGDLIQRMQAADLLDLGYRVEVFWRVSTREADGERIDATKEWKITLQQEPAESEDW